MAEVRLSNHLRLSAIIVSVRMSLHPQKDRPVTVLHHERCEKGNEQVHEQREKHHLSLRFVLEPAKTETKLLEEN